MSASESTPTELRRLLSDLHRQVGHLERAVGDALPEDAGRAARAVAGEQRWPVSLAVAVAIFLQFEVERRYHTGPHFLLPGLEIALGLILLAANPTRITRPSQWLRVISIALVALVSVANAWESAELIKSIIVGQRNLVADQILGNGAAIYVTNIIVFGLWYWEWDGGGPIVRLQSGRTYPDFLFPQAGAPERTPPGWAPTFTDYLYVSYTNATAFSPTDTMPLSRWAKVLMMVQSAVALLTMGLVIARAVNIFPS